MKAPYNTPTVKLIGKNGNAFAVLGATVKALKLYGADKEYTDRYIDEAMSGDYDHLLGVTMEYVNVV